MGRRPRESGGRFSRDRGLIRTRAADNIGKGKLNFQLSGQYFQYADQELQYLYPGATVDYHMFISRATLTYGISDYLEFAANLDVRNWLRDPKDAAGFDIETYTRGGIGDTQLTGKISVPLPTPVVKLGALGEASLATGDESPGFTTGETEYAVLGLLTFDFVDLESFVPTRLHVNAGYRFNKNEEKGYGIFSPDFPDETGFMPPAYPPSPRARATDSTIRSCSIRRSNSRRPR